MLPGLMMDKRKGERMNTETRILTLIAWKKQAVEERLEWATLTVTDKQRLSDFKAGASQGWDQCLNTLKAHDAITIVDPIVASTT